MTHDAGEGEGDALQSSWPESSTLIHARWSKLSDNDVKSVGGYGEYLVSRLQERYGYSRARAEHECQAFIDELEATQGGTSNLHFTRGAGDHD